MPQIEFQIPQGYSSMIKVIGVGGGGGNAVNNMYLKGIKGVDFVVCNTDVQALDMSPVPHKVRLGANHTEGLGAGANPEIGRLAAEESMEELRELLKQNTKMVFITAGMGGGTGTGAAPVIASLAKEMDILTVGIVTTPFKFEGRKRMAQAKEGIQVLEQCVDTILTINNDNLTHIFGQNVTMKRAFEEADSVLCDAAKGIAEIITKEGYINVDFADVQTIMRNGGTALMGSAVYSGEDRAIRAAEDAISSPLLDNVNIHGSQGILVNITASPDSLRLDETTTVVEYIQEASGDDADIIFGTVYDDNMEERLSVTVIATGFNKPVNTNTTVQSNHPPAYSEPSTRPQQAAPPANTFSIGNYDDSYDTGRYELREEPPARQPKPAEEEPVRYRKANKRSEYDYHNPDNLQHLEEEPAYLRKQVKLDPKEEEGKNRLSRMSLEEVDENYFRLNEHNSFLHDNVD